MYILIFENGNNKNSSSEMPDVFQSIKNIFNTASNNFSNIKNSLGESEYKAESR
jgi:hypothetical protein